MVHLVLAVVAVTAGYAGIYLLLSPQEASQHGLREIGGGEISVADALYFSLVTETTLGYGDIRPTGLSRALAGSQVLLGLVIAGIAVAKITSLPGRELRAAARKAVGDWTEISWLSDGKMMVTFSTIAYADNSLSYSGENYFESGKPAGFFQSELIDIKGNRLRFHYSNRDSHTDYFVEGISSLRFLADGDDDEVWMRCLGTTHDFGNMETGTFQAIRASPEERQVIHGVDDGARLALIETCVARAGSADE